MFRCVNYLSKMSNSTIQSRFISKRAKKLENSVWSVFTPLAVETKAVNLGQGFPDFPFHPKVLKAYQSIEHHMQHQYCRSAGDIPLNTLISKLVFGSELNYDPLKEIIVTPGATNALYVIMQTHIDEGDEVILFSPHFDVYPIQVELAGGKPVYVPFEEPKDPELALDSRNWKIDPKKLESVITEKTKMIVLNNPHNPLGKMFTEEELKEIADIAKKHDLIVISDEVYEYLVFPSSPLKHIRIANIEGMKERTITISSAGKTYSNTGWKIGWMAGPVSLLDSCARYIQYHIFCQASPLQRAITKILEEDPEFSIPKETAKFLEDRYLQLKPMLEEQNIKTVRPYAGYFTLAKIDHIHFPRDSASKNTRDYDFCLWMPRQVGVCAIPPSAFYEDKDKHLIEKYVRFSFAKTKETIESAREGIKKLNAFWNLE